MKTNISRHKYYKTLLTSQPSMFPFSALHAPDVEANTAKQNTSLVTPINSYPYLKNYFIINPFLFYTYHFRLMIIFWRPGNLNLARRRASCAWLPLLSLQRTDRRTCPILTLAHVPWGFPKAPLIPVWSRSAPAHDNILFIRNTWKGCTLTLRWKASFPAYLAIYLLHAMRAASRASLDTFSFSQLTRWTQKGNSSTPFFFIPTS